ncbi:hypothetical protein Tco_1353735 [Tanacetum coccineum]
MTGIQHTSPSGDGLCSDRLFDVMPLRDSIVIADGNELARAGVQNVNVGTAGRAPLSIETREMTDLAQTTLANQCLLSITFRFLQLMNEDVCTQAL